MKKNDIRRLSMRYCPNLRDHVVVMTAKDGNGFSQSTCLSSHLCRHENRQGCEYDKGKNTFTM